METHNLVRIMIEKPIEPRGEGHRMKMKYYEENFYVVVTDQSFDISYSSDKAEKIAQRTKVGFDIISGLITQLLQEGAELEDIASTLITSSREKGDLADSLCIAIEAEILSIQNNQNMK